jgi:beta-lactamase class A
MRRLKHIAPAVFLLATALAPARAGLHEELAALNARYGGQLGLVAKNLNTGESISYNGEGRYATASVIKLAVMAAYFHEVAAGRVSPSTRVRLEQSDKKPGLLEGMAEGLTMTLADAVRLMIVLSDNTATNLVLDHLGRTPDEQMKTVNAFLRSQGFTTTKLLNRLYSLATKADTPEAMRFGIGVAAPADMVVLLERMYRRTLVDSSSSEAMLAMLTDQFYDTMIPRFLPAGECARFSVAHKTGSINEVKSDVGLVMSDRATFAIAIFVNKHPDHRDDPGNGATMLGAKAARAVWNHFSGMAGEDRGSVNTADVDWTSGARGTWAIYRSSAAPFPHPARREGWTGSDGTVYPYVPHYADSSIVVFVPKGFRETLEGANIIVHFHGHMNDNISVMENFGLPEAIVACNINALLVLPQGPNRARDSFGGKMEDPGGFRRMVEDVLATMKREGIVATGAVARVIVTAHSGGYRPAGYVLDRGGLNDKIEQVFLFDALYGQHEYFRNWLLSGHGIIRAAYTEHLAKEHAMVAASVQGAGARWSMSAAEVDHDHVPQAFFPDWLARLPEAWKTR